MMRYPITNQAVAVAFEAFAPAQRETLHALRNLILDTVSQNAQIGTLEESLKWGEPAYRPKGNRIGTTVRLGISPKAPQACAIFVNCKTSLMATFRDLYPDAFDFEGDRALILAAGSPIPVDAVSHCVSLALTYHAQKRQKA
jgi:Domain of unknown function (DU1801)